LFCLVVDMVYRTLIDLADEKLKHSNLKTIGAAYYILFMSSQFING